MQMVTLAKCFESLTDNRVDRAAGVIRGVCVARIGEARGHDVFLDAKTLETIRDVGRRFDEGVKVKLRHSQTGVFQSILEESFGLLKNFSINGDKVIGDVEMLASLEPTLKERAFEMAEKMPKQFGLSIDFSGGFEKIDGKKYLRCEALKSVDLTDKPAATDGLFSMKEPKYETGTSGKHSSDCMCAECDKAKMEAAKGGSGASPLGTQMEALAALVNKLAEKVNSLAPQHAGMLEAFVDGKTVQLSAKDIITRLDAADKMVSDSRLALEKAERQQIINKLQADGRVCLKEANVAYKLEELQAMEMPLLKFAAINSQVIPTKARAVYTGNGAPTGKEIPKGADGKPLTGDALLTASWEANGYDDIDKMIARSMSQHLS